MDVLLVGTGEMAVHHYRALLGLGAKPIVIGRGAASAEKFSGETGASLAGRDLSAWLTANPAPQHAVVSVSIENLASVCLALLGAGVKQVLLEKPGALHRAELEAVGAAATKEKATVVIGYNRRFYSAVRMAREIIAADGGPTSCHFDFTEWSHQVAALARAPEQKARWLLANSSHVIDTAFFLVGAPKEITTQTAGSLDWHPSAAVFTGSGKSDRGALFSYHADWTGPGRWSCEVVTRNHKLVFMPMEELRVMKRGSVALEKKDPPDDLDARFKPGVYRQAEAFLAGKREDLCDIAEHLALWPVYERIAGY